VPAGDGQQGHVLGQFLVGETDGGVQRPLRAHQGGVAEQSDELKEQGPHMGRQQMRMQIGGNQV